MSSLVVLSSVGTGRLHMGGKAVVSMVSNITGTPRKMTLGPQHQEAQGEEGPPGLH